MSFGGNGNVNSSIAGSTDVSISNPSSRQVLTYDKTTGKWKNVGPSVIILALNDPTPDPATVPPGALVVRLNS